jgi:tRNA (cmo5U34)-methyltransferase
MEDRIKQHFEEEARDFERIILTLIPDYPRMVEALVAALPFESATPIRVIDLGCGTGTIAQSVLAWIIHDFTGKKRKGALKD